MEARSQKKNGHDGEREHECDSETCRSFNVLSYKCSSSSSTISEMTKENLIVYCHWVAHDQRTRIGCCCYVYAARFCARNFAALINWRHRKRNHYRCEYHIHIIIIISFFCFPFMPGFIPHSPITFVRFRLSVLTRHICHKRPEHIRIVLLLLDENNSVAWWCMVVLLYVMHLKSKSFVSSFDPQQHCANYRYRR